ncbi:MAG: plasmid stabilization system [Acidobacteria bacterium]|nr:plasmid stabilization system [Acidobacteriota bacterium]
MNIARFHPAASAEFLETITWYVERSIAAAEGFVREVEHAVSRIEAVPERYPRTRVGARRFVLFNYPFDVVYRVLPAEIEIIAVAHHARRPAYWQHR